jgi:ligand-binding SRPBCC domain-containing protein
MKTWTVEQTSVVGGPPAAVWASITSLEGINREMGPWLQMTLPPEARGLTLDAALETLGEPLFASRVLLFGIIPVERMRVTLVELEPGRRFVEQSPMLTLRYWRHERTLAPEGSDCRITDRLTFAPPVAVFAPILRRVVSALFAHRHRRLAETFPRT